MIRLDRRRFLTGASLTASATLTGCFDALGERDATIRNVMEFAGSLTYRAQRLLLGSDHLAREYTKADIRQPQRPNGSTNPQDADYRALVAENFASWRLPVSGLVDRPLNLAREDLLALPSRTQITRHDCVEGWSCIAQWTGVPLADLLDRAGVRPQARFVVFDCFDTLGQGAGAAKYYESIDMLDARHPQTILAYGLNGEPLPVANGAPLRVRVERQLGYKMAKYIRAITVTEDLSGFGGGGGGFWEDRGYEWFAGI